MLPHTTHFILQREKSCRGHSLRTIGLFIFLSTHFEFKFEYRRKLECSKRRSLFMTPSQQPKGSVVKFEAKTLKEPMRSNIRSKARSKAPAQCPGI